MLTPEDYIDHLVRESARFADVIQQAPPQARVPSCPDWDADDLLWHLGEVQSLWTTVVREKLPGDEAEKRNPQRPADRAGLLEFYRQASAALAGLLRATSPDTPAWTWSREQTVGFIYRRQAHEALIHRIDAELTAGSRTPVDAPLAADGVDEGLRIMYGACPDWGTITPVPGRTVRLRATDTGDSWLVTLARFTGTDPDGKSHDEPDIHVAESGSGEPARAEITGTAADLDCWLWHRPPGGPVEQSGDQDILDGLAKVFGPGID
ncbi:MAG TPA: maleylpyruvate isomerase family mycothiol-dependent enzyme [Streptosporangiaceae bacterium]|jgi:uncharacterized protein (TIGR03083 family)